MKINDKEITTPEELYKEYSNSHGNMLVASLLILSFLIVVLLFYPTALEPFSIYSVWSVKGSISDWTLVILSLSALATVSYALLNLPFILFNKEPPSDLEEAFIRGRWGYLIRDYKDCFIGPPLEEIMYRWLVFFDILIITKFSNYLLFGFLGGAGLLEILFNYIGGPITNFFTFGYMAPYFLDSNMWAVGSAIAVTNSRFMEGHSYQGCFGLINSWYVGMILFCIMITYGLPVAIMGHIVYNMSVYTWLFFLRSYIARLLK